MGVPDAHADLLGHLGAAMFGGTFPWPALRDHRHRHRRWIQLLTNHQDTVASIERSMERREQRRLAQLARRERRQLGGGPPPPFPPAG